MKYEMKRKLLPAKLAFILLTSYFSIPVKLVLLLTSYLILHTSAHSAVWYTDTYLDFEAGSFNYTGGLWKLGNTGIRSEYRGERLVYKG